MKREITLVGLFVIGCSFCLYSANVNVITNADSGPGSLRQAIMDINSGSDGSNTINMQIPGNSPISVGSDLPVIKKNTVINSTGKQSIDGQGQYRLFATIMADLTINNCTLQNGAAIGGDGGRVGSREGGGGGLGAGGGVYIDRGKTLTLGSSLISSCKAQGGNGGPGGSFNRVTNGGGGGASFSSINKNSTSRTGGGDYPGLPTGEGGKSDGSEFLIGYGGGQGGDAGGPGGGNGPGRSNGEGGYCGGGGGFKYLACNPDDPDGGMCTSFGGGGGNGGGSSKRSGGGEVLVAEERQEKWQTLVGAVLAEAGVDLDTLVVEGVLVEVEV